MGLPFKSSTCATRKHKSIGWHLDIEHSRTEWFCEIIFGKIILLAPLWWGILCYVLLRLANPYLKEHGVKLLQINNRKYKALIKIFTIVFLIALIYWSYGFTLYVVFQPMPFLVGYYIMNHRIILGISWCIEAILIYVSFETW